MVLLLAPAEDFLVKPGVVSWEEMSSSTFDSTWRLPDKRKAKGQDLLQEMRTLAVLEFETRDSSGSVYRGLGDLALAIRTKADQATWLRVVLESAPELEREWGSDLRELLLESSIRKPKWDPDDDSSRDGMLLGSAWDLSVEGEPWKSIDVETNAQQAATIIRANLAMIKTAENDYRAYFDIPGSSYEEIYPREEGYVRGEDPQGNEFAALKLYFRCELPLWYPDYRCDLRMLNRIDSQGNLVCDIYSTSGDFHWLAGRDIYLPLQSSSGEEKQRAGYLVVRQYGFDLDGVPDDDGDVQAALRQSLGSLKLRAEKLAGALGSASEDTGSARVPAFEVRGRR